MSTEPTLPWALVDLSQVMSERIRREFSAGAATSGPTFAQFKVLLAIRRGVCHVGKLAEAFGISQPAASVMVDALVNDGYVKRVPQAEDRRQIALHLTAKATARVDALYGRAAAKMDARLASLPAAERKRLTRQIQEITALLLATGE